MRKILLFFAVFFCFNYSKAQYVIEDVVTNLLYPVAFQFLPGGNALITLKGGAANIYALNNTLVSNFWNFTDSTYSGGECGLLGVCLDPNFAVNRHVYFFYVKASPRSIRIVRLTENNNSGTNPVILFEEPIGNANVHVGGNVHFGTGNKLYFSIGNNSTGGENAQSLNTFKGKILRINSDGTIPTDNPFYDDGNPYTGNDDRIWAYGLRNPFDFCFNPYNDSLYATENMPGSPDEVNYIRKGKNYGFPICYGPCNPPNPLYQEPLDTIPGNGFTNYGPTGIMFYTGTVMPELTGTLLFIGIGASQPPFLFKGLAKCVLGNPPAYDTLLSRISILDINGYTALRQGPDGYIYTLRHFNVQNNMLRRIRPSTISIHNQSIPHNFSLSQNYPNPFNPTTSIKYEVPKQSFVSLKVYNVLGIEVESLVNETKQQGNYEVNWNATSFPSGVYFYELQAGDYKERRKMILIK